MILTCNRRRIQALYIEIQGQFQRCFSGSISKIFYKEEGVHDMGSVPE
jgi:hypothetical protein